MSHSSLNLIERDFDAYAPEKATSNVYSRPRLEVKQRALAWARAVVARLAELGISVDVHGSDEHPSLRNKKRVDCQWIFFWRDQEARDELDRLLDRGRTIFQDLDDPGPYTRHAFLALRLDVDGIEVCFAVHPKATVDIDNLRARLAALDEIEAPAEAVEQLGDELIRALDALPDEFMIGVAPEDRVPCHSATKEMIRGMVDRAVEQQAPLWIGWRLSRDTALEHAEILDEQLEDALVALAPTYKLIAWSRDNDLVSLDRRLEGARRERARTHAEAEAQTERWLAEQAEARRRSQEQAKARGEAPVLGTVTPSWSNRRPSLATLFKNNTDAKDQSDARPRAAAPKPQPSLEAPVRAPAASAPANTSQGPSAIEKGTRVRVLSGPFANKVGVIGELDGRGSARVLLGLLSTRVDISEVEPVTDGRERPALHSSHRRPLANATRKAR